MASGGIRKLLGPLRKNLSDRIKQASIFIEDGDMIQLKACQTKLAANIEYHTKLTNNLLDLLEKEVSADEKSMIKDELTKCTKLHMDAEEIYLPGSERVYYRRL